MKIKKYLSLFFILASCISKQEKPRRFLSSIQIKSINNIVRTLENHKITAMNDNSPFNQSSMQSCLNSICGKDRIKSYQELMEAENHPSKVYNDKNSDYMAIDKEIKRAVLATITEEREGYNDIEILENYKDFKPDDDMKVLANSAYLFSVVLFTTAVGAIEADIPMENYLPSKEVILADMEKINISTSDVEWVKNILTTTDYYENLMKIREIGNSGKLGHFLYHVYPRTTITQAIVQSVKDCRKDIEILKRVHIVNDYYLQTGFQICSGKEQEIIDESSYLDELKSIYTVKTVFFNTKYRDLLLQRKWNWVNDYQEYTNADFLKDRAAINNLSQERIKELISVATISCHKSIKLAYEYAPSDTERVAARKNIHLIKNLAEKIVNLKNPELKTQFSRDLNKVRFYYLKNRKQLVSNILHQLRTSTKLGLNRGTLEKRIYSGIFQVSIKAMHKLFNIEKVVSKDQEVKVEEDNYAGVSVSSITEICDHFKEYTLSDHMLTTTGASYLSWPTVIHSQIGLGIIAHELGHYVSEWLRNQSLRDRAGYYYGMSEHIGVWERRACVNKYHPFYKHEVTKFESQYTEEDWADYFGGLVAAELKKMGYEIHNFGCTLIEKKGSNYISSTVNSEDDSHSQGLFRAVHIEKSMNGQLPRTCQNAIRPKKLPSCF